MHCFKVIASRDESREEHSSLSLLSGICMPFLDIAMYVLDSYYLFFPEQCKGHSEMLAILLK